MSIDNIQNTISKNLLKKNNSLKGNILKILKDNKILKDYIFSNTVFLDEINPSLNQRNLSCI